MRQVKCNLCDADDYTVRFPRGYAQLHQIVCCNRCGLMYANPQELVDCERFQEPDYRKVFEEQDSRQYIQKQYVQLPDNLQVLRVLDELRPQRGRLLEIGSFCGILLDRIRADGWQVEGIEPDRAAADYSRAKYGLTVVPDPLPNPNLPDHSFDAIIMLHVIEHMPDPSATLQEIRRLLSPGGVLVVETPRFDSLMFKLLGRRERSICNCNGHIYFFTVPTLQKLLEKNSFKVERVDLVGRTLTVDRFLYNAGLMTGSKRVQGWLYRIAPKLGLDKLHVHVNVRDMQRMYCRA